MMAFTMKNSMWYDVRRIDQLPVQGSVQGSDQRSLDMKKARVSIPTDSLWFDGHFPNNPVLPGIAQLGMVYDIIAQDFDGPVSIVEVNRVRFKQMIQPDDELDVTITPHATKADCFSFRMTRGDELVCNGMITVQVNK